MAILVGDCPRCGAKEMSFDVLSQAWTAEYYGWQNWFEAFCVCRKCHLSTTFVLSQKNSDDKKLIMSGLADYKLTLNEITYIESFVSLKDIATTAPPDHIPEDVAAIFREGASCLSIGCFNAAGTMFRLCVDMATRAMLPTEDRDGLNSKIRRDLGLRLPWLFDNEILPASLRVLSTCIKEDGNDGAHRGSLKKEDADDMSDFTFELLDRVYSEPTRLKLAEERRNARRTDASR